MALRLELRHLQVLVTIAEAGSIRKAAAVLGVAQPTVTSQLRRVEAALGGPLFVRSREGVVPTALGRSVICDSWAVLGGMERLVRSTRERARASAAGGAVRVVSLCVVPHWPVLLRAAESVGLAPVTSSHVRERPVLEALLRRGNADLVAYVDWTECEGGFAGRGGIRRVCLSEEPLHLALPSSCELARGETVPLAALADEDWAVVQVPGAGGLSSPTLAGCAGAGFTPRIRHHVWDDQALLDLVEVGRCVGFVPASAPPRAGVALRPPSGLVLVRHLTAAWRLDSPVAVLAEAFMQAVARDLPGAAPAARRA
ncbi:LysR family transcriptional regulator [Streptomyces sp. JJ38]|uniref:LysR family transcriptional regulator n=1 Tax=Streptomyces sp. JJ38 TaxID=2738128 RepID=UPI001C590FA3|nr:LysR family transcriptional regulator [Streptomyces sp. JJ38]MBW1599479.1 LysR family transcriptional regulator [Streptomyces sp. JJ38]